MSFIFAQFQYAATEGLQKNLRSKITKGAMDGRRQAAGTAEEWNTHSRYHHMTYKGMLQRSGVWNHPQKGRLDWPEELAAPVYDTCSDALRDTCIHTLKVLLPFCATNKYNNCKNLVTLIFNYIPLVAAK